MFRKSFKSVKLCLIIRYNNRQKSKSHFLVRGSSDYIFEKNVALHVVLEKNYILSLTSKEYDIILVRMSNIKQATTKKA